MQGYKIYTVMERLDQGHLHPYTLYNPEVLIIQLDLAVNCKKYNIIDIKSKEHPNSSKPKKGILFGLVLIKYVRKTRDIYSKEE
jgi:hypothetical protein